MMRLGKREKNRLIGLLVIIFMILQGCIESPQSQKRRGKNSPEGTNNDSQSGIGENGTSSTPTDGSVSDDDQTQTLSQGRAELRHIIDPFDGTIKTKVTVPKNFTGILYLSGINFASLKSKLVSARFRFGRELEPVIIEGTITRAEGITPQTDIEVLALDMGSSPFGNIRLLYDLFDYTDYRDGTGSETLGLTSDPRDGQLYCRGLKIEHDPTFDGGVNNPACDAAGERCLYAYAKILDAGLHDASDISQVVTEPQIDINGQGYTSDSQANALKKCLPDNNDLSNFNNVLNTTAAGSLTFGGTAVTLDGNNYTYKGPFRTSNEDEWEIKPGAIFSEVNALTDPTGVYQFSLNGLASGGFRSFMFPRAAKMNLQANVSHFSSTSPFDTRSLSTLLTAGETEYMDGCNLRVLNFDETTGETISSCNVSAVIDLVVLDPVTREVSEVITSSSDIKLQLIRASETNFEGKEVLFTSLKRCSNSNACGSDECCYNERCWSKELVGLCIEDVPGEGNLNVGDQCTSDYQCSSLCCNAATNTCDIHTNDEFNQQYCEKSPGQSCVAREWCRQESIPQCFIVKTGVDPTSGDQQCALRCFNVPTFGNCRDGRCEAPEVPDPPIFDPLNPDCTNALDPSSLPLD